MNWLNALACGAFFGVALGLLAGYRLFFDKNGREYLRGYREALEWARLESRRIQVNQKYRDGG